MMWESFERDSFDWRQDDCIAGYGVLTRRIAGSLQDCIDRLLEKTRSRTAMAKFGFDSNTIEYLAQHEANLRFLFGRLRDMPCTESQARRGWAEVQRAWLTLSAMWDYLTIFRPRMAVLNVDSVPEYPSTRRIGAFTRDELIALRLATAGLPVWLIRERKYFLNQNILKVVTIKSPGTTITQKSQTDTHPVKA